MRYFKRVLIAVDQVGTTLVGGWPDETISSYAHRLRSQGKRAGFFADVIDWVWLKLFRQADHCLKAYQAERERVQMPPALRD